MRTFLAPFVFVALFFVANCAPGTGAFSVPIPDTDRQNLATAEIIFTGLVDQANEFKESGVLAGDTLQTAQRAVAAGSAALDGAHAAIADNDAADLEKWFSVVMETTAELQRTLRQTGDLP